MSLHSLLPLMKKTGSTLSPEAFQHAVNVVFHDIEAGHYDVLHANMWGSLQQQIELLADDVLKAKTPADNLRLLDIGSGTGLSTELLLASPIGKYISHVTLLDTSSKMLDMAEAKIKKTGKPYDRVNSDVTALDGKYDVIIISSVLHHIPDLDLFFQKINEIQNPGGILLHLQDPNGDYFSDPQYTGRTKQYDDQIKKNRKKTVKDLFPSPLKNAIKRWLGKKSYLDLVNDRLIEMDAIKNRMNPDEIWSVTDIHVEGLPFSSGSGISLEFLKRTLDDYTLVGQHSYAFFGYLSSELLPEYQPEEQRLIAENQMNGRYLSAAWIKK